MSRSRRWRCYLLHVVGLSGLARLITGIVGDAAWSSEGSTCRSSVRARRMCSYHFRQMALEALAIVTMTAVTAAHINHPVIALS